MNIIGLICADSSVRPEIAFLWDALKLGLGFLLTTVFGGWLAQTLQSRSWAHQNRVRLLELERAEAAKVFDELSRLMDKRLYRMLKFHWALKRHESEEDIKHHLEEYREVLYEWNDCLNRNLALTEAYFGPQIRAHLEGKVYEGFSRIGSELEERYRLRNETAANTRWSQTATHFTAVRAQIYSLNASMIDTIRLRQREVLQSAYPVSLKRRVASSEDTEK